MRRWLCTHIQHCDDEFCFFLPSFLPSFPPSFIAFLCSFPALFHSSKIQKDDNPPFSKFHFISDTGYANTNTQTHATEGRLIDWKARLLLVPFLPFCLSCLLVSMFVFTHWYYVRMLQWLPLPVLVCAPLWGCTHCSILINMHYTNGSLVMLLRHRIFKANVRLSPASGDPTYFKVRVATCHVHHVKQNFGWVPACRHPWRRNRTLDRNCVASTQWSGFESSSGRKTSPCGCEKTT